MGDWDRHADQWRWAGYDDSIGTKWKPIARDRDFSFVVYNGVIPYILDRRWANRDIDGYNRDEADVVCLTYKARHQDGRLLAAVNWEEWERITEAFMAKLDDQLGLFFTISMDIQLLLGLILYFFLSPITTSAFSNFAAAMANSDTRFYVAEHLLMMIVAVVLVHVGRIFAKRNTVPAKKHRVSAIFYLLALGAILLAIPWDRALFPSF